MIRRSLASFALALVLVASAQNAHARSRSVDEAPPPMPPLVPFVIVLAAIGATVARMNRRGP